MSRERLDERSHEDLRELVAAYAMGALDAAERGDVERHLAGCAECRVELESRRRAVDALPLALGTRVAPPPRLKTHVMAAALAARRLSPWALAGLATAAVVIAALGVANIQLRARLSDGRARIAQLVAQVGRQEVVLEVVDSPDRARKLLLPPSGGSRAYGKLFTSQMPYVVVMVARLPQPPDGRQYQLWLTQKERTFLAGSFAVNHEGFGLLVFEADGPAPSFDMARLTLQEPGGVEPAGAAVLAWRAAGPTATQ